MITFDSPGAHALASRARERRRIRTHRRRPRAALALLGARSAPGRAGPGPRPRGARGALRSRARLLPGPGPCRLRLRPARPRRERRPGGPRGRLRRLSRRPPGHPRARGRQASRRPPFPVGHLAASCPALRAGGGFRARGPGVVVPAPRDRSRRAPFAGAGRPGPARVGRDAEAAARDPGRPGAPLQGPRGWRGLRQRPWWGEGSARWFTSWRGSGRRPPRLPPCRSGRW
jgi:hypothetical protein